MTNQFADPRTGDMKLFVDFEDLTQFDVRFERELKPRLVAPASKAQAQFSKIKGAVLLGAVLARPVKGEATSVEPTASIVNRPKSAKLDLEIAAIMGDLDNSSMMDSEQCPPPTDASLDIANGATEAVLLESTEAVLLAEMSLPGQVPLSLSTSLRGEPALTTTATRTSNAGPCNADASGAEGEEEDPLIGEAAEAVSVQLVEVMSEHLIEEEIKTVSGELLAGVAAASHAAAIPMMPVSLPTVRAPKRVSSRGTKIAPAPP